jgi:hypothetical protein
MWVPTIVSIVLYLQKNGTNESPLFFVLTLIVISNMLGAFAIFALVFIHWKKGQDWWLKISPYLFGFLLFFVYLIMPVINVIVISSVMIDPNIKIKEYDTNSYIIFFLILYTIRVVEFLTWVRKSVFDDARTYLMNRELLEGKDMDELQRELITCQQNAQNDASAKVKLNIVKMQLNEKASYLMKERVYGSGESRIGKSIEFTNDIYSLCFVAQAADEVMDKLFDVVRGKHLNKWKE